MNLKLFAAAAAITVAVSGLTSGVGTAPGFQPDPGRPPLCKGTY
jgi:hypothetical protein